MKTYTFQAESPSSEDLFDSKSHAQTARSVFNTLEQDNNINLVGLEGELGSGKSTVIELVKKISTATAYRFIEFDAERFQHGATKKALIETIYNAIEGSIEGDEGKEKVKRAKNVALGNHFEYTSVINSDVNIWIVWFAISVLMAARVLPEALVGVGNFLLFLYQSGSAKSLVPYDIDLLSITALFIIFLPFHIVWCAEHKKRVLFLFGKPPSTGDIFKRNSTDRIHETIEINKEVGAYELQEALAVFVNELSENSRFILIIDNLDRVTEEKLREVWSDIEVFTSIAHNKIQLVLPYSRTHIASSLMDTKDEGREFISKRIPVTFRVSPIVSADWKTLCEKMISDALGPVTDEDSNLIIQLISLWSDFQCKQITPRYLKMIVNSVVSVMTTDTEDVSLVSAFFYQVAHQCCEVPMVEVLSRIEKSTSESTDDNKDRNYRDYVERSWVLIERTLSFESCSRDLVSIHYQTKYQIAESEILRSPLETALENSNSGPFIEKLNIYGYSKIVNDILIDEGAEKFIPLILKIQSNEKEEAKQWVDAWAPVISAYIEGNPYTVADFDNWIDARIKLYNSNLDISIADIKREYSKRNSNDAATELDELKRLYKLSSILEITPLVISKFNAPTFVNVLWPNRTKFSNWKIEDTDFNEAKVGNIFDVFVAQKDAVRSLLWRILGVYRLGWMQGERPLAKLFPILADSAELEADPENVEKNVFAEIWHSQGQTDYYVTQLAEAKDNSLKARLVAQAVANITLHRNYNHQKLIASHLDIDSDFNLYLANYLAVSCSFSQILDALNQTDFALLIRGALKILIEKRRISSLGIQKAIQNFLQLQSLGLDNDVLIKWLEQWSGRDSSNLATLQEVNYAFVEAVFSSAEPNRYRDKFLSILGSEEADIEWWLTQLGKPNENVRYIFEEYFGENQKKFTTCAQLTQALKKFFTAENDIFLKEFTNPKWIESIAEALPTNSIAPVTRILDMELNKINGSIDCQSAIVRNYGKRASLNPTSPHPE